MRIPLTVAARPSQHNRFPRVALNPGKWTFQSDHKDSTVIIKIEDREVEPHEEVLLDSQSYATVLFRSVGSETSITVFACLSP